MKRFKIAPRTGALLGLALLLVGAAIVAPATAHRDGGKKHAKKGTYGHHHDQDGRFLLRLTGEPEPPPGGDPDARGVAKVVIDPDEASVCVRIKWRDIDGVVTAAHIHQAPPGQAGPIVVGLFSDERFAGQRNKFSACVVVGNGPGDAAARQTLEAILADPDAYYLNVHSTVFPDGAIRAQLTDHSYSGRGHHRGHHGKDRHHD